MSLSIAMISFKLGFWVFCRDVVVSDGTGSLMTVV